MRVGEVRVLEAELDGLLVHELDELVVGTGDVARDGHRGIVAGLHEQRLEQLVHGQRLTGPQERGRLPHLRGCRRDGDGGVQVGPLERDDGGHDLGDARHGSALALAARPQDPAISVDERSGAHGHIRKRRGAQRTLGGRDAIDQVGTARFGERGARREHGEQQRQGCSGSDLHGARAAPHRCAANPLARTRSRTARGVGNALDWGKVETRHQACRVVVWGLLTCTIREAAFSSCRNTPMSRVFEAICAPKPAGGRASGTAHLRALSLLRS